MAISNVNNVNPLSNGADSSTLGKIAARVADVQVASDQQPSATVTISAQAQKLSQAQNQSATAQNSQAQVSQTQTSQTQTLSTLDTTITPNAVPQSKETTAAPGIQFMSGERKTGRVNTFA